jgi:predicted ATPase
MLTRIAINNYNCLVGFEVELPRRLLLVGSNGSGKSSLWEALVGLQDVIVRGADVADAFPTRSLTKWLGDAEKQEFEFDFRSADHIYTYRLELEHNTRKQTASLLGDQLKLDGHTIYQNLHGTVSIWPETPGQPNTSFPFGRKRSFLPELEAKSDNAHITAFRGAISELWLIKHNPTRITPTTAEEVDWLERDGSNFSSWFRGVLADKPEVGNLLNEALRPAMPGLQKIAFDRISQKVRELMLQFRTRGHDYSVSASEISDGQRSLLLLHGLLVGAFDHARLAFLDEPEMGLAPHEMQPWLAQAMATLDEHDGQLFVISHHPAVVDYLAPERTLRFSRPNGGPTRIDEVTLETTGGIRVSRWLASTSVYEDEHE